MLWQYFRCRYFGLYALGKIRFYLFNHVSSLCFHHTADHLVKFFALHYSALIFVMASI